MERFSGQSSGIKRIAAAVMLLLILMILTGGMGSQKFYLPLFTYAAQRGKGPAAVLEDSLMSMLPICTYGRESGSELTFHERETLAEKDPAAVQEDGEEGSTTEENQEIQAEQPAPEEWQEAQAEEAMTLEELLEQENANAKWFVPAEQVMEYDWASMEDYETLLSTFYAIDSQALAGSDLLNLESLRGKDLTIDKTAPGPQILIYHTHSLEAFADSVPGDRSQTIVGVGDFLTQLLEEEYGYSVLHHTEEYDTVRDDAYAKSLPAIEQLLAENPTIQVVIDLHRDAGSPDRNMVVDINGKKTARFMFFNGISRSKKTGDIAYLANPNLEENLAFSFQMQVKAGEYYPGLTRKIYIKQYRYNMHFRGRTLLIELGDENNTVEEAMNACYPIAHLLDMVLSGKEQ